MSRDCFRGEGNRTRFESSHTVLELHGREMSVTKNQPIYRRTKKPAVDLLAQQLERARAAQRARERQAEKDAERFGLSREQHRDMQLRRFLDQHKRSAMPMSCERCVCL